MASAPKFVGIQISPIALIDEGIEACLDTLQARARVNVLMIGTVSWLGLKVGRRTSHALEGWPDHGKHEPFAVQGGSYVKVRPEYFTEAFTDAFDATEPETKGIDILDAVLPAARARGMKVMPEFMEPVFPGAAARPASLKVPPGLEACLEVDVYGRTVPEPCTSNPFYRAWWRGVIAMHAREYAIDGIMWCNERKSPLDRMMQGEAPGCFCATCRREASERGIDVERVRAAFRPVHDWFTAVRSGAQFADGAFLEFVRIVLAHPEILLWERFWLERSKDLDRELYGLTKWCNPKLSFGLNIWNRNHFNPIRRAQWAWDEQVRYADWVKPITYQHQAGGVYAGEMGHFAKTILRDIPVETWNPAMYLLLGLREAPWTEVVQTGMDPDTYVAGECANAVRGVGGRIPVYMGIGIDAPRSRADQAKCTPDIAYRSVHATYRAGGAGVVFSPSYAAMNLSTLDGAARALDELGLH